MSDDTDFDDDLDEDDDDESSDVEWDYPGMIVDEAPHRSNLVGGFATVHEFPEMQWSIRIAQRHMRQRCTFTRTFDS